MASPYRSMANLQGANVFYTARSTSARSKPMGRLPDFDQYDPDEFGVSAARANSEDRHLVSPGLTYSLWEGFAFCRDRSRDIGRPRRGAREHYGARAFKSPSTRRRG